MTLKNKLFSLFYFGTTPPQLAVDIAIIFIDNVKKPFCDKEIISVLAINIKQAFDKVIDRQVIKKLWEQGMLLSLIRYIASFFNNRTATLRLHGKTRLQKPVIIRVSQGLPVVLILFILIIALLFKMLRKEKRKADFYICGYVDNGLLTCQAEDKILSISKVKPVFYKVEAWAKENDMIFNLGKFEAIHFS